MKKKENQNNLYIKTFHAQTQQYTLSIYFMEGLWAMSL